MSLKSFLQTENETIARLKNRGKNAQDLATLKKLSDNVGAEGIQLADGSRLDMYNGNVGANFLDVVGAELANQKLEAESSSLDLFAKFQPLYVNSIKNPRILGKGAIKKVTSTVANVPQNMSMAREGFKLSVLKYFLDSVNANAILNDIQVHVIGGTPQTIVTDTDGVVLGAWLSWFMSGANPSYSVSAVFSWNTVAETVTLNAIGEGNDSPEAIFLPIRQLQQIDAAGTPSDSGRYQVYAHEGRPQIVLDCAAGSAVDVSVKFITVHSDAVEGLIKLLTRVTKNS